MTRRAAYGLACSDFESCWFPPLSEAGSVDVRVVIGNLGGYEEYPAASYRSYVRRAREGSDEPPVTSILRGEDGHFRIIYADGAEFVIDPSASAVFGVPGPTLTLDDVIVYLQGPVLGFLLRLRGVTCLHASAVHDGERAFGIVGDGGMGKSTSAAAFARLGHAILTDDVLALDDRGTSFAVQPGLPRVMLWPESVAALWGDVDALPLVVRNWEKRYLDLGSPGYRFADRAQPLGAIYVLAERRADVDRTLITPLKGAEALIHLVANTYGNDLLDTPLRARELDVLGRLVSRVPVRRVTARDDRAAITPICEAILADFRQLGAE